MRTSLRTTGLGIALSCAALAVGLSTATAQFGGGEEEETAAAETTDETAPDVVIDAKKTDRSPLEANTLAFIADVGRLESALDTSMRFEKLLADIGLANEDFDGTGFLIYEHRLGDDFKQHLKERDELVKARQADPAVVFPGRLDPRIASLLSKPVEETLAAFKTVVDTRDEASETFAALRKLPRRIDHERRAWKPQPAVIAELQKIEQPLDEALAALEARWIEARAELRKPDLAVAQIDVLESMVEYYKRTWRQGTLAATVLRMVLNEGQIPADYKSTNGATIGRFQGEVQHVKNAAATPAVASLTPTRLAADVQYLPAAPESPVSNPPQSKIEARIRKAAEKTLAKLEQATAAIDQQLEGEETSIDDLGRLADAQISLESHVLNLQTIIRGGVQWGLPHQLQQIREAEATANTVSNPPAPAGSYSTGMSMGMMPGGGMPTAPRADSGYDPPPGVARPDFGPAPGISMPGMATGPDRLATLRQLRKKYVDLVTFPGSTPREAIDAVRQEIHEELKRLYDEQVSRREKELEEVASALAAKQKELADRKTNREALVMRRAEQIFEEVEGSGWREDEPASRDESIPPSKPK